MPVCHSGLLPVALLVHHTAALAALPVADAAALALVALAPALGLEVGQVALPVHLDAYAALLDPTAVPSVHTALQELLAPGWFGVAHCMLAAVVAVCLKAVLPHVGLDPGPALLS